jgi:hypothetical protein
MLLIRARAVAGVPSDDTRNSASRRYEIFTVNSLSLDISPLRDLAASANAVDLAVDLRVFFIKFIEAPLRRGCGNIGGARLAVAYRCQPGSG